MARSVHDRIKWFMSHLPGRAGYCLHHTWEAIGAPGSGGSGIPSANAAIDYVREHGKLHQGNPPRGAMVLWHSSTYGHAALSLGRNRVTRRWRIASVDVHGPNTVGKVDLSYPVRQWGHTYAGWTDWWAGETYPVGRPERRRRRHRRR